MDRIAISETLATRIGNPFFKNDNSFQRAMKQRVLLERIFNREYCEQNRNFRNSCHKNPEFFFSGTTILSGRQRSRRFFLERIFNCRSSEKNRNFRIHQIRGRISYNQHFIKLTSIAGNFDNYRSHYLMNSDKALLKYSMEQVHERFAGKTKYDVVGAIIYIKFSYEHSQHQN